MRQFKMRNAAGQTFDLMRRDAFLHAPTGLGFGSELTLAQVGRNWIVTDELPARPDPSGDMVFAGYAQYDEFVAFVQQGGLYLGYKTGDVWAWLPCAVSMGKGEIGTNKRLECSITFMATGPWAREARYTQSGLEAYGVGYPRRYPYSYGKGAPGLIVVKNGNLESPFRLHIYGPAVNPAYVLRKDGNVVARGRVLVTIAAGRQLIVDSDPARMEIGEYTTDGAYIGSRYGNSDFGTERIFMLPAGESTIQMTDDTGAVSGIVEVEELV